jgi:hypothetical protein
VLVQPIQEEAMLPYARVVRSGIHRAVLVLALLPGCATMSSTKEELQTLGESEGIVVGSVLLTVARAPKEESGWAFLKGRKAGELDYAVSISETAFNPLKTTYSVPAKPGQEEVFVKKLPAGSYSMNSVSPSGFLAPQLKLTLAINFTVKPRQISYIGKLLVDFPDRIMAGSPAHVTVVDAQRDAAEELKTEHPGVARDMVKDLANTRTSR